MKKKIYKITEAQFYKYLMQEETDEVKPEVVGECDTEPMPEDDNGDKSSADIMESTVKFNKVGKTKSGKDIYDYPRHSAHKDFSKEDNEDATEIFNGLNKKYKEAAKKAYDKKDDETGDKNSLMGQKCADCASTHKEWAKKSKKLNEEELFESIQKTQGGLQLRKLIKEETTIKGEFKSAYGKWHSNEWNLDGTPVNSTNAYNKYIMTIDINESENKHDFSTAERKELSSEKEAMPDGSFPIRNNQDLKDAIKSYGRAKDKEAAKSWIKKRAKELDSEDLIPDNWK